MENSQFIIKGNELFCVQGNKRGIFEKCVDQSSIVLHACLGRVRSMFFRDAGLGMF